MSVHGVDLVGCEAGVGQSLLDDALLGGAVGAAQPVTAAVLVGGGAAHDRKHGMAVALRV